MSTIDVAPRFACRWCIVMHERKGTDVPQLPATAGALALHIERDHHIPVMRPGETEAEMMGRFQTTYPDAGGPLCKCPDCAAGPTSHGPRIIGLGRG